MNLKNIQIFFEIISSFKLASFVLLILILLNAATETIGLGMLAPLMELFINPSEESFKWLNYFTPVLRHFPDQYRLIIISGIFVGMILLKNIFFILSAGYSAYYVFSLRKYWQCHIMEKYMYAKYPFFLTDKQGTLLNNLLTEPSRGAKSIQIIIDLGAKIILGVCLYVLLLFVQWKITVLMTFSGALIFLIISKLTQKYALNVGREKISLSQRTMALGAENLSAVREVKTFSLEKQITEKFEAVVAELVRIMVKFTIVKNMPKPLIESLLVLILVTVMVYVNFISNIDIKLILPSLLLFLVVAYRLMPVIAAFLSGWINVLSFIPSLVLVHKLCQKGVETEELKAGVKIQNLTSDIVLSNIEFAHTNDTKIFHDLNISFLKGKVVALVGKSGSGKTTIVDILFGLQEIQGGKIQINDLTLKDISIESWRNLIGYVSQDTFLFDSSIRENILVGNPGASDKDLNNALKSANAFDFIHSLPDGIETIVGDRGLKLSGGQRQRIAIARAIIRNPEIYIFDEATSSLDTISEKYIQKAINDLALERKKTIILISHRLSTVQNADMIYVIDEGKIVESGTYSELEKNKGVFFKMNIM